MKRIRIYVLLTVLVTMLIILILGFMACKYTLNAETHVRYVSIMNVASEKISKTINGMEMNAMNVFDEVQKNMDSERHRHGRSRCQGEGDIHTNNIASDPYAIEYHNGLCECTIRDFEDEQCQPGKSERV